MTNMGINNDKEKINKNIYTNCKWNERIKNTRSDYSNGTFEIHKIKVVSFDNQLLLDVENKNL